MTVSVHPHQQNINTCHMPVAAPSPSTVPLDMLQQNTDNTATYMVIIINYQVYQHQPQCKQQFDKHLLHQQCHQHIIAIVSVTSINGIASHTHTTNIQVMMQTTIPARPQL